VTSEFRLNFALEMGVVLNWPIPMPWLRALSPAVAAAVVLVLLASAGSCGLAPSLQLLQVLDIAPRDVELGDRIAIVGDGFAPGKPARVTFRGTLHRPGEPAQQGAIIETTGTAIGPQRVEVTFAEGLQASFCRAGDRATHTTFEGDVEIAFAAAASGGPPIAGVLQGVTLDVRPPARTADVERDGEGTRLLEWIGVRTAAGGHQAGLLVESVAPGSRAETAGILAGDVITNFDGVRVASASDAVPAPGDNDARVGLRRAGWVAEMGRSVSVAGFRRAPPEPLLGSALTILAALTTALLLGSPAPTPVAHVLQRVVSRLRPLLLPSRLSSSATREGLLRQKLVRVVLTAARPMVPSLGAPIVVDLAVCASFATMPFGQYLVAERLDVGILLVAAATALAAATLLVAGSAWQGVRATLDVVWQHVPGAIAAASVVVSTGSLRVVEVERAQGGWPWEWLAFRSPASLIAACLLLQCVRIEPRWPRPPGGLAMWVDDLSPPPGPDGGAWYAATVRAHHLVIAGLVSALFLGGWSLPGLSPAQQDARPLFEVAGALLFAAKGVVLLFALASARWALPPATLARRTQWTAVCLVPLAVGSLVAVGAWARWGPPAPIQWLCSGALVLVAALAAVAIGHRLLDGLMSPAADAHLNPFL
jgi:NADH-quinone oxidoreductase subunit H